MNIIVWGINYAPEVTGIGPCNRELCNYLSRQGHAVQMVSGFSYYPGWVKDTHDASRAYRTDQVEGIPVHRCWHYVPRRPRAATRILHEASFVLTSFLRLLMLPRPDVYIVISPPLLLGAAASLLTRLRRVPFIFHVQDLQPDAALGLGMLKPGAFTRALYALEALAYRMAFRVSGISEGMVRAFEAKGVERSRILHFPNGVRLDLPFPARGHFRTRNGLNEGDLLVVYSGNLGIKQGLGVLLDAAAGLRSASIKLILCGDGAVRESLAERIRAESLTNVMLLPLQREADYREMLADADVAVITQQEGTGSFFFPSKLLSALAAGLPVVAVADGASELAHAVSEGGFGLNIRPGCARELGDALEALAANRARLPTLSANGRRFVQRYESSYVMGLFHQSLLESMNSMPGGPTFSRTMKPDSEVAQALAEP